MFITALKEEMELGLYVPVRLCVYVLHHWMSCINYYTDATCEHGKVHLVGNNALSHGRVEYCYEGSWYSVCAEDFDEEGARVVCESLGHDTAFGNKHCDYMYVYNKFGYYDM